MGTGSIILMLLALLSLCFLLTTRASCCILRNMYTVQQILLIAAEAQVDPRTVKRHLEGGTTRPSSCERIKAAIKNLRAKTNVFAKTKKKG